MLTIFRCSVEIFQFVSKFYNYSRYLRQREEPDDYSDCFNCLQKKADEVTIDKSVGLYKQNENKVLFEDILTHIKKHAEEGLTSHGSSTSSLPVVPQPVKADKLAEAVLRQIVEFIKGSKNGLVIIDNPRKKKNAKLQYIKETDERGRKLYKTLRKMLCIW
jgi:hypothetical protein